MKSVNWSRRKFIGASAVAGAGLAAVARTPSSGAPDLSANALPAGSGSKPLPFVRSSTMKSRFTDVDALLSRIAEEHSVPGLAVAVMAEGELAHVATHGWRDRERGLPMTDSTPSRWYSISKPLTALALAQLVARGRLRWDDVVSRLVPGVRFADPVATERADIRDCLLHRTGLPDGNWTWWQAPSDPRELLDRLPHFPCSAGFRSGHHYQNLGFTLLGEVFRACGTTWHQAIQDLLQPLGIRPLTRLAEFVASDRMVGYGPNGFSPARPPARPPTSTSRGSPRRARSAARSSNWPNSEMPWPTAAGTCCPPVSGRRSSSRSWPSRHRLGRRCCSRRSRWPAAAWCTGANGSSTGRVAGKATPPASSPCLRGESPSAASRTGPQATLPTSLPLRFSTEPPDGSHCHGPNDS